MVDVLLDRPSNKIGLVKTESASDDYPFFIFLDLTCYLEDTGIGVFWLQCAL